MFKNMWKWKSARPTNTRKAGYAHAVISDIQRMPCKDTIYPLQVFIVFAGFERFEIEYDSNKCGRVFFLNNETEKNFRF